MFFILLLFSLVYAATLSSGVDLSCYNDYDRMMNCNFSPGKSNCSEFTMDLDGPASAQLSCIFNESRSKTSSRKCECAIEVMDGFVLDELIKARLWNAGTLISEATFNTTQTIKPKVPTTPTVKRTENGNYFVSWKTNYKANSVPYLDLSSYLTYRKKGEEEGVTLKTQSFSCDIPGSVLETGSDYAVSVRTHSGFSSMFSDSSEEALLSTPAVPPQIFTIIIIVTCIAVVVLTIFLFWSFFRLKDELWNKIPKYAKPDLLYMLPVEPRILSPPQFILCSIYVDSPKIDLTEGKPWSKCSTEDSNSVTHRSGSGTEQDSSSLGYAHTCPVSGEQSSLLMVAHVQEALARVFPNLAPADGSPRPLVNSSLADDGCTKMTKCPSVNNPYDSSNVIAHIPGSSSYNNMTYLSTQEPVEIRTLPCESAYQSSEKGVVCPHTCPGAGQQDLHFSSFIPPLVQTDFSYQPCDNSPVRASLEEDMASSEMNTPASQSVVVAGYQSFREAVSSRDSDGETGVCGEGVAPVFTQDLCGKETLACDVNPCYIGVPTPELILPPSDGGYQALQSVLQHSPAWQTPALTG